MDNKTMEVLAEFILAVRPITELDDEKFLPVICTMMELHCLATGDDIVSFSQAVAELIKGTNAKEDKE